MKSLSCILLFVTLFYISEQSSILLLSNVPSGSHEIWYNKLARLLAERGHEVVLLSTGPYKAKTKNITSVVMENSYQWLRKVEEALDKISLVDMVTGYSSPAENIRFTSQWSKDECEFFIKTEGAKSIINKYKNKHFDLIIVDFPCDSFLGFIPFFGNPPFIVATPYNNAFNMFDSVGLYDNPSYVPTPFTPFQSKMTLKERTLNLFYKLYTYYVWMKVNIPWEDALAKEVFGSSTTHVSDILRNVSLLLVGTDPVLTAPKPLPPAYIPVGGLHIDKVKPLPKDLKKFMDEAKDGVIYFSFGSNFKSIFMSPDMIQMFLEAFRELPQRVIWKLEWDNNTGIPANVLISKWLPQNDILGHPNVRCFISHGGLLGTQEAIYHGVPILDLPFMFDQVDLAIKLEINGVGIRMRFDELSKDYIKRNLQKVMEKSYRDKMQEWSRIFKDTPLTPSERAVWWIEYVLRNPSETHKYLRLQSVHLYWYQRLMLDVAAVVLLPVLIVLYLFYYCVKLLVVMCCSGKSVKSNAQSKSSKKNKRE